MSDDSFQPIEEDSATGDRSGMTRYDTPPEGTAGYETPTPDGAATVWTPDPRKNLPKPPPPPSERSDSYMTWEDIRRQLYGGDDNPFAEDEDEEDPFPEVVPHYEEKPATPRLAEREKTYQESVGPVTSARRPGRPRKT